MDAMADQPERHPPFFAMSVGLTFHSGSPIELGDEAERDSSLFQVAMALEWIELDLQVLIVYTPPLPDQ
jgi:hypothetical protein